MLAFAAVFGFAGAIVSLLISKRMAKWSTKARVIDSPRTPAERWLVDTVAQLAKNAGIGMPEVAIFPASQSNAFATGWNKNDALVAVSEGLLPRLSWAFWPARSCSGSPVAGNSGRISPVPSWQAAQP